MHLVEKLCTFFRTRKKKQTRETCFWFIEAHPKNKCYIPVDFDPNFCKGCALFKHYTAKEKKND